MFYLGNRLIKPELIKYVKESNEKSLEKFINYNKLDTKKLDLVLKSKNEDFLKLTKQNNDFFLLTVVSLFSFLAGYNFRSLIIK